MRWCERIWTTIATCKKQNRNVFEFIHSSLIAYWTNNSYPELLRTVTIECNALMDTRIQLSPGEHPARPKIQLGVMTKRDAETIRVHIETLHSANKIGNPYPPVTAEWLANV